MGIDTAALEHGGWWLALGTSGTESCSPTLQVLLPGGSLPMIQTRARSVHTQRCPHLLVLWPPRPRRASQEKRLQPPWCAVPPSYTAPLQPPRPRHSALQTRDLQRARRLQVPMASMSLHASSTRCLLYLPPPPPGSAEATCPGAQAKSHCFPWLAL